MRIVIIFFLLVNGWSFPSRGYAEELWAHEGYYAEFEKIRFDIIALFLPYNPKIAMFPYREDMISQCKEKWPDGTIGCAAADFLWIDSLDEAYSLPKVLMNPIVIYIATEQRTYKELKRFLERGGFSLLSHWYLKNGTGHAIFLRKDFFHAAMNTLNYSQSSLPESFHSEIGDLSSCLRRVEKKPQLPRFEGIDYIYMINLDERPKKFEICSAQLKLYGIYPYRFSAVNGWKLPVDISDRIGVRFTNPIQNMFMGTVYRNINGQKRRSNEFINDPNTPYFTLGMSPGTIGIVLSHLSVLQDAYDSGYQTIWVMEDDVEVIEEPGQLSMYMKQLDALVPDWDILFTDIDTKNRQGVRVPCRSMAIRPNFPQKPLDYYLSKFYPITPELSKIGMRYGAYSMIVRRSAMKKILDYYKAYNVFLPYDMDFWLIPDLHMYTVNKDIVSTIFDALTDNRTPGYEEDVKKNN